MFGVSAHSQPPELGAALPGADRREGRFPSADLLHLRPLPWEGSNPCSLPPREEPCPLRRGCADGAWGGQLAELGPWGALALNPPDLPSALASANGWACGSRQTRVYVNALHCGSPAHEVKAITEDCFEAKATNW